MNKQTSSQRTAHTAKRLARLAAVQALYQDAFGQQQSGQIIRDSIDSDFSFLRDDAEEGGAAMGMPDKELFAAIVEGVAANAGDIDAMITGVLDARFSAKQFEKLLQTILRAGAFELHHHNDVPAGVIINDYVDVAHAFYDGKEPGLVNGVLDKLAGKLR